MRNFKKYINWQLVTILVATAILGILTLPNQYQPSFFPQAIKDMKINLGLDLQGGSQLDFKIDLRSVAAADQPQIIDGVLEVINKRVNKLGVSEPNIYTSNVAGETHIIVELAGIKDLDEAKRTVGKTIQLEFKELNTAIDPNEKNNIKVTASDALKEITAKPTDFTLIAEEESKANPGRVIYNESELLFPDEITGEKIKSSVLNPNVKAGAIIPNLIEDSQGLFVKPDGTLGNQEGFFIVKVLEKNENVERTQTESKKVETSHILISYKNAERADAGITRSKKEAKKLANEVLLKAKEANADFAKLAKEFSDEPGSEASGGKLPKAVEAGGVYAPEFTDAALKLTKDGEITPTITETEFGFHIIKADKITPEKETKTNETQVKLATLYYSTTPDNWKTTELTGKNFKRADVTFDQMLNPQVSIQFDSEGAKLFEKITERNISKQVAIFVGGEMISAPTVNEKITGGQAVINGRFTVEEAQALARDLNTGAIPAPISLTGQYSIGASLGQEALHKSLYAGAIGIIALIIFMVAYYRIPGLVASIALSIYSLILTFLIKANIDTAFALLIALALFGYIVVKIIRNEKEPFWEKTISLIVACFGLFFFTFLLSNPVILTLAGIAGVILSIGMAVDANVLIFERIGFTFIPCFNPPLYKKGA